ncbi:MAG: tRNA glutamyl-Q(34) synthetase GluQRS [Galactobacter sp.]
MSGAGRYAPSPSGDLHLGNLRTAILAWLMARSTGRDLILRVEDLDTARTKAGAEQRQVEDLAAVGVTFDRASPRQSERLDAYADAIATLKARGLLYECFCTRRDILDAPRAPHTPPGHYPGTCRNLTEREKRRRRSERPAAWRLRAEAGVHVVGHDALLGDLAGEVDDVVIQRNDGAPAYNLAVVVDDHSAQVDQVVRGNDLASSTPRQAYLRGLLYGEAARDEVTYVHVPLVLNAEGKRLAKRDGAVTLRSLADVGFGPERVRDLMLDSLGLPTGPLDAALGAFDLSALPREPWIFAPPA